MITWSDGSVTHIGLTVGYNEENYDCGYNYVGYAIVFNPETNKLEKVSVDVDGRGNKGNVTEDLLPVYQAILDAQRKAFEAEIEAKTIRKGKTVLITQGKNKGTVGKVFWLGQDKFNRYQTNLGIKTANDKTVFVDKYYCEVYVTPLEKVIQC